MVPFLSRGHVIENSHLNFAGPFVKRFLYLYSNDGEKKTYSSEVYFDNLTSCCCSDYVSLFDTEEQRQCLGCCN